MLSSIWVAVITTLPAPLAISMMRFCSVGTSSVESSTPRSPRATITPSVASRICGQVVDGLALLDLGDHRRACRPGTRIRALHSSHVGGLAHERERHVVDAVRHAEGQVAAVLLGEGRGRELHAGQVHALVGLQQAAVDDHGTPPRVARRRTHPQLEVAVVEQDRSPGGDVAGQRVVGRGDPLRRALDASRRS